MRYAALQRRLPRWLHRHTLYFEALIDDEVKRLALELPAGARVLDAGAGESRHRPFFPKQRYFAADLAVGDTAWNYTGLDALCDLESLPFRCASFDAALNIVTLEHVRRPEAVLAEIARVLAPGGRLLLIAPQDWEVHQAPHDYFRYTRYGLRDLLVRAGFAEIDIRPAGGFFRLLSRRLLNALQFFPGLWIVPAVVLFAPPALLLPWLDPLDRACDFTLGYTCTARKP